MNNEREWEQPQMSCPSCGAVYDDFDGVGVVFCEACRYCRHLARSGKDDDTWTCDFCGDVRRGEGS